MIQRIQSVWLLLAAVLGVLSYQLPFYEATNQSTDTMSGGVTYVNGGSNLFLVLLTGLTIFLALATIFFYKKRKQQLRMAIVGAVISILLVILNFSAMRQLGGSVPSLTALVVFAIPVLFVLAARGIWKDEKLVESLDRLR